MRDKAIGEMAEILFPLAEQRDHNRSRQSTFRQCRRDSNGGIPDSVPIQEAADVAAALAMARTSARPDTVVVITGSIYIVGEAMRVLGVRI